MNRWCNCNLPSEREIRLNMNTYGQVGWRPGRRGGVRITHRASLSQRVCLRFSVLTGINGDCDPVRWPTSMCACSRVIEFKRVAGVAHEDARLLIRQARHLPGLPVNTVTERQPKTRHGESNFTVWNVKTNWTQERQDIRNHSTLKGFINTQDVSNVTPSSAGASGSSSSSSKGTIVLGLSMCLMEGLKTQRTHNEPLVWPSFINGTFIVGESEACCHTFHTV